MKEDQEFQEFRDLMKPPSEYEEGFGWTTVIMAIFVGLLMVPGQMYMSLVAGMALGSAAQWVTVILYVEVARRAFMTLKRPQIFIMFYMCGGVLSMSGAGMGLLWHQFMMQSEEIRKMGITEYIPAWYAPRDPDVLATRNFLRPEWFAPFGLMVFGMIMGRVNHFGLGYVMFRLTSDAEKLPFPMAPVGAMGITALAESSEQKESWRWRTFCIGSAIGIAFGAVYLALPAVTGAVFSEPFELLPIPFVDLTNYTEDILPAMPFMISFDLGLVLTGMVLPFWAMVGSFFGLVFTLVVNPLLYTYGYLPSWDQGLGGIQTVQATTMDFYFSFDLGLSLAIAVIGFVHLYVSSKKKKKERLEAGEDTKFSFERLLKPPEGRGDIPLWVGLVIYVVSTLAYIGLAYYLVNVWAPLPGPKFPLWLLLFYGFVYTPIITYASTRMEGIVGQQLPIPFVREATFILSGYKGAAIWFAPIPMHDYSRQAMFFRTMELTGTKITSVIKADILIVPIMIVGVLAFSQFIWSIAPVPSEMFPYAQEFWELNAFQQGLVFSSTLPGEAASPFQEAFSVPTLVSGFGLAMITYGFLELFNLPIFLVFGIIRGLDMSLPQGVLPMFAGALLSRFVFRKWYGEKWPQYRIVVNAGFGAGMGLITMLSLGIVFMTKSVIKLPF
jgi:hypothetical protein